MSDDAIDNELTQMTGEPALARAVKDSLARLRDGAAGEDLAEMARDLLAGGISIRQVTRSGVYTQSLLSASAGAVEWLDTLSPEELQRVADDALAQVQEHRSDERSADAES